MHVWKSADKTQSFQLRKRSLTSLHWAFSLQRRINNWLLPLRTKQEHRNHRPTHRLLFFTAARKTDLAVKACQKGGDGGFDADAGSWGEEIHAEEEIPFPRHSSETDGRPEGEAHCGDRSQWDDAESQNLLFINAQSHKRLLHIFTVKNKRTHAHAISLFKYFVPVNHTSQTF